MDALLRRALRHHHVPALDPPPNYSVKLAGDTKHRRGAGFHFVYRSSSVVVRTRDVRRAVHGLFAHLATHVPSDTPDLLTVQAVGLVGDGGALIVPNALRQWMSLLERRLNLKGLRVVDMPSLLVDAARHEVVVPEPALQIDWAGLDGLERIPVESRPDPFVPVGRYPIRGWAFLGDGRALSRASAVALATRSTVARDGAQSTLDALARVMRGIEPTTVAWTEPPKLAAALAALG